MYVRIFFYFQPYENDGVYAELGINDTGPEEGKKDRNHSFTVDTDRYVCGKKNETRQKK